MGGLKTQPCQNILDEGFCRYGASCQFAHSRAEMERAAGAAGPGMGGSPMSQVIQVPRYPFGCFVGTVPYQQCFGSGFVFYGSGSRVFFLNPDPVPDPDPGKEKTFRKAIQKNLGVPTSMVLIYLYF